MKGCDILFHPNRIIFEKGTRDYEIGQSIYNTFSTNPKIEIVETAANKIKPLITMDTAAETYQQGKKTLVVSKKRSGAFQTCKPSADYMLPLVSGCMGQCEYCYLHTQLGDKPFVRVNVNLDDIFAKATKYMLERPEQITSFEGSATSDPVCVEPYTHALEQAILFFAKEPLGRFRFVTKYSDVDTLLSLEHNNKTEIRFSINTKRIRDQYEHFTADIDSRIKAAAKVMKAGYPVGFLIAPVFLYDGWEDEYQQLILHLQETLPANYPHQLFFEVITHRFTPKAKDLIQSIFPDSSLPMEEDLRQYKYGQFGYGKYVYKKEDMHSVKAFFQSHLMSAFPNCEIKYIV
ncbi:spore photoproduct lyase [Lachnospiraceae bacterium KM106-2]|nr:spore photoproduct lyase [Lachnospiraceae bacterium KM106-2]